MSREIGFAISMFAGLTGVGCLIWLSGLADAAKINAQARLQEAQNAARTLSEEGARADE